MANSESAFSTSASHSSRASSIQSDRHLIRARSPALLRPEDAFSPPRRRSDQRLPSPLGRNDIATIAQDNVRKSQRSRPPRDRSRSRRRGVPKPAPHYRPWKKLLWVKQNYPDNYTDEETFLDHLQRNPRLRPYEFWPLTAESTIVVQHACSVIIFVTCFTAIFQERIAPGTVAGWATGGAVTGWFVKETWRWIAEQRGESEGGEGIGLNGKEYSADGGNGVVSEVEGRKSDDGAQSSHERVSLDAAVRDFSSAGMGGSSNAQINTGASRSHSRNPSITSAPGANQFLPGSSPADSTAASSLPATLLPAFAALHERPRSSLSPRMQEYVATGKSAALIVFALLGLSPILKSLTRSYSSDSIWALSALLLAVNIFTFDYGAGPEQKAAAPLSTNAAVMASTVLASRLDNTGGVFGLMLFSIEVFGLFPVFRLHLRAQSWGGYVALTIALVVSAAGGLAAVIAGPAEHRVSLLSLENSNWTTFVDHEITCQDGICVALGGLRWGWTMFGAVAGLLLTALILGVTSWWLIGLQRYKNEIRGPWDPARPVIGRGGWE